MSIFHSLCCFVKDPNDKYGFKKNKKKIQPLSANLVIHCHGGGFVAQSSKSHEVGDLAHVRLCRNVFGLADYTPSLVNFALLLINI